MKGVSYEKARKRWTARKTVDGKRVLIGRYKTEKEAEDAYLLNRGSLLSEQKLSYEHQDSGIDWLKPFREIKRKRELAKARDAYNQELLESL